MIYKYYYYTYQFYCKIHLLEDWNHKYKEKGEKIMSTFMSTSNGATITNKLKKSSFCLVCCLSIGAISISTVFIALFFIVLASNNQLGETLSKVMFG